MRNTNVVVVEGNLTKDPELTHTSSGKAYCNFSIANNRDWKDNKKVNFFDCNIWEKGAELLTTHMKKGGGIIITGELVQDTWTDKEGHGRSKVKIKVNEMRFTGKANNNNQGNNNQNNNNSNNPPQQNTNTNSDNPVIDFPDFGADNVDNDTDVPF